MSSNAPLMPVPNPLPPASSWVRRTQAQMLNARPSPTAALNAATSSLESAP